MNGHNNEYIIVFGNQRYEVEWIHQTAQYRFDSITDARKKAKQFENAHVFKLHHDSRTGDVVDILEIDQYKY